MNNEARTHRLSILDLRFGEANEKVTHHDFASKDELICFLVEKFNTLHPNPEFIFDGPHMHAQPGSTWWKVSA